MPAIEIRNLTKRYGSVTAVSGLELTVASGEVLGFLGPNGAGKSTVINILLDLVRPTSGEVAVAGHNPQQNPEAVRRQVGVVPEDQGFYSDLSAEEHIRLVADVSEATDNPRQLLERVGLSEAADRRVSGFSTGMRQRLGLGLALVGDPNIMILDEPLAGVDPPGLRRLREVVLQEVSDGTTVLLSSHVLTQVEAFCDRVALLNDGEIVFVGDVSSFRSKVGDESELRVTVDQVPAEFSPTQIEGITKIQCSDEVVRVSYTSSDSRSELLTRLQQDGATVRDVETRSRSLGDLFVEYLAGGDRS